MIKLDGASLIFATSFGYFDPFMLDMAKKYPDVQFRHAAGLWTDKNPKNAGSYFGYLDQGHYVERRRRRPLDQVEQARLRRRQADRARCCSTSTRSCSARSKTNPNATVQVIFTGDWSLPVREAEATNALVDAGCDVITCHVDSPKVVIETAEGRGVKTCGHNANQAPLAPKGFITGAEYKWTTIYSQFADMLPKGEHAAELRPRRLRQGLRAEHAPTAPARRPRRSPRPTPPRPR